MNKQELIESRAKYLFEIFLKRNDIGKVWCNDCKDFVPDTSCEVADFIDEATKDVEWFASQGVGIKGGCPNFYAGCASDCDKWDEDYGCGFKDDGTDGFIALSELK